MPAASVVLLAVLAGSLPLIAIARSATPAGAAAEAPAAGAAQVPPPVGEPGGPLAGPVATAESEIAVMRTETSKTFTTSTPNVLRKEIFSTPVHFKDEQGNWESIETDIVRDEAGELETAATDSTVTFAESAAEPSVASVDLGDGDRVGFAVAGAADAAVQVEGATASYDEVLPGTDLELTSLPHGVKEDIVLSDASRTEFDFPLALEGVTPRSAADGGVELVDESGAVKGLIPPGDMTDSRRDGAHPTGATSRAVTMTVSQGPTGWVLHLAVDRRWLSAPERVFPVRVDPTIIHTQPYIDDTYVTTLTPGNNSTLTTIKVGTQGTTNRSFVLFNQTELAALSTSNILRADLILYESESGSCTPTELQAYQVTQGWFMHQPPATSWPGPTSAAEPLGSVMAAKGFNASCPAGNVSMPILPAVRNWASGAWPNYGLMLRAKDESTTAGYKAFSSTQGSAPPTISVTYQQATVFAAGAEITSDTVWGPDQSPYVISGHLELKTGKQLTLLPGTVVKFDTAGYLESFGSVYSLGTANDPVYITSLKDDTVGGDTNGDGFHAFGTPGGPAPGDWIVMELDRGPNVIDNTVMRYGGAAYDLDDLPKADLCEGMLTFYRDVVGYVSSSRFENSCGFSLRQDHGASFALQNSVFVGNDTTKCSPSRHGGCAAVEVGGAKYETENTMVVGNDIDALNGHALKTDGYDHVTIMYNRIRRSTSQWYGGGDWRYNWFDNEASGGIGLHFCETCGSSLPPLRYNYWGHPLDAIGQCYATYPHKTHPRVNTTHDAACGDGGRIDEYETEVDPPLSAPPPIGNSPLNEAAHPSFGPVDAVTGELTYSVPDLGVADAGQELQFSRVYRSGYAGNMAPLAGELGAGWQVSYTEKAAAPAQAGQPYKVTLPNGRALDFTMDATAGLVPVPGNDAGFEKNADNSMTMTAPDNSQYRFNAQGQMTSVIQRDPGHQINVARSGGLVTSVTGVSGRSVTYARTAGKLTSLTDSQGRQTVYTYDGSGRLGTGKTVDGKTYTYGYDAVSGKLATVTSPLGRLELQVGYDSQNRVSWFEEQGKGRTTVAYYPLEKYATFTRADGGVLRMDWDAQGREVHERTDLETARHTVYDAGGRPAVNVEGVPAVAMSNYGPAATFTMYDGRGNAITTIDAYGEKTATTYDANRQPLITTYPDPAGDAPSATISRQYDSNRRLVQLTDKAGGTWLAGYNGFGQLVKLADPKSTCDTAGHPGDVNFCTTRVSQWTYATNGDLRANINGAGERTDYNTDAMGRVTTITDPFQRAQATPKSTTRTYLASGLDDTVTTPRGAITKTFYNNDSQPIRVEAPEGAVTWYTYDAIGRPSVKVDMITAISPIPATPPACTDARVTCSTMTYDPVGRTASITDANGKTQTQTYNKSGLVTESKDPLNARVLTTYDPAGRATVTQQETTAGLFVTTNTTYDRLGRTLSVAHPDGGVDTYEYDELGRPITHTTPRTNGIWRTVYDAMDRPVIVRDPIDNNGSNLRRIVTTYDAVGNTATKTDQEGRSVTYTYDDADRATGAVDGLGESLWSTSYVLGRKVWQKDGEGNQTSFGYNDDNQVVTTTNPENGVTTLTLDLNGRTKQAVDPNNVTTQTDYDLLGRVKQVRYADTTQENFTYDKANNVLTKVDRAGKTWSTTYDGRNRPLTQTDPQAGATKRVVNVYNLAGWLTTTTDQTGLVTNFAYDSMGRKTEQWTPQNAANHDLWTYDKDGLLTSTTVGGVKTSRKYDKAGYPDLDEDGGGTNFDIWTNKAGQITQTKAPLSNPVVTTFDHRGRVKTTAIQPSTGVFNTTTLNYDKADRLTSKQWPSGRTDAWTYDKNGNLTGAKVGSTAGVGGPFVTTTTYDYFPGGQLKNANLPGGGQFQYAYNATYEQVNKETRPDNTVWNFDWTGERLTQVRPPSGVNVVNGYDNVGRMTSQTAGGKTRTFTYDDAGRPTGVDNRVAGEVVTTSVLLVVNNKAALSAADAALKTRLETNIGYVVTLASTADAVNTTGRDVVVIAPSSAIGTKYQTSAVPVVDLRADSWQAQKLSTAVGTSTTGTTAFVEGPAHAIADGPKAKLSGSLPLFNAASNQPAVADSTLGAGATQVVSRQQTPSDQNQVFAYEAGAALIAGGGNAPARRVGFGVDEAGIAQLSATGWNLFDNAVMWARGTDKQPSGAQLTFGYTNGLLTSSNGPHGNVSYTYNDFARMASMTVDGNTTNYVYSNDLRRRLTSINGAMAANFSYDSAGRNDSITAGQVRQDFGFDQASRPTSTTLKVGSAQTWASAVTYTPDGQVDTRSQTVPNGANSFVDSFNYDNAGRLDGMQRAKGSPTVTATAVLDIDYDAKGNRSKLAVSGTTNTGPDDTTAPAAFGVTANGSVTYVYDNAGKITSTSDGQAYTYDVDGKLKDSTTPAEGRRKYGYDPFGALVSVDKVVGSTTTRVETITRDGLGRELTRSQNGRAYETLLYSGQSSQVLQYNNRSVSWGKTTSVLKPDGSLLGTIDANNGVQMTAKTVHGDLAAMAPTLAAKGTTNSVTNTYDPFGHQTRVGTSAIPLGFQGQLQSPSTGLVDMGARMYNPNQANFLQADSVRGDAKNPVTLNRYAYGNGDPVSMWDPTGNSALDLTAIRTALSKAVATVATSIRTQAASTAASVKQAFPDVNYYSKVKVGAQMMGCTWGKDCPQTLEERQKQEIRIRVFELDCFSAGGIPVRGGSSGSAGCEREGWQEARNNAAHANDHRANWVCGTEDDPLFSLCDESTAKAGDFANEVGQGMQARWNDTVEGLKNPEKMMEAWKKQFSELMNCTDGLDCLKEVVTTFDPTGISATIECGVESGRWGYCVGYNSPELVATAVGGAKILDVGGSGAARRAESSTFHSVEGRVVFDEADGAAKAPRISNERPVVFERMRSGQTGAQDMQMRSYAAGCNAALCDGALSPTGRVSTQGSLTRQASRAAKAEKAANPSAYGPGQHVGHVPDTTWTGVPDPHSWLGLDGSVNNSLGAQAGLYPIGYQPTGFWFIDDYIAEFGSLPPPRT